MSIRKVVKMANRADLERDGEMTEHFARQAGKDPGFAVAFALMRCAGGMQDIAYQLKSLGNGDAASTMGAMEFVGVGLREIAAALQGRSGGEVTDFED